MFLLVAILVLHPASPSPIETSNGLIQRINYGVVFKEEPNIILAQEYWMHTFRIPLPKRFAIPKVEKCTGDKQGCSTLNSLSHFVHNLHMQAATHFNETMKSIQVLLPSVDLNRVPRRRQTRALLPFVGSLSKSFFGTATMDDVNILASHINMLTRHTNQMANLLVQHSDHLSSFMKLTDSRMNNLKNGIKNNAFAISLLATKLANVSELESSFVNISEVLLNQVNKVTVYKNKMNRLVSAVQTLIEGKLSPFLISKSTIGHTLHQITGLLRKSYHGFHLVHTDPSLFYAQGKFLYARHRSDLYITLKFPISSQPSSMKLFKVISMPVPISNTSGQATQLLSIPEYLAVSQHHDNYVQLKAKDLINCNHGDTVVCNTNYALTPFTTNSCVLSLYTNNVKVVHKLCNFRYLQNYKPQTNILEITSTSVLVYHSSQLSLNCPAEQKILPGCHFCIIDIPCRCSLSTSNLYFAPRLVNCYNQSKQYSTVHPVNLALLQEFFDDTQVSHISANSTFSKPVSFSIPQFQMYNHTFNQFLANDLKSHLNLKKMVEATKKEKKIFQHLAEPLIDGQIELPPPWPSTNDILTIVSISIAAIALACCILLFFKVRKMHIALMLMQNIHMAKSQEVPSFIYKALTTAAPSDSQTWLMEEFSLLHAYIIIGTLSFILVVILFAWLYHRKSRKHTFLALELTTGGQCVLVPIMQLSLCPSYYDIQKPNIGTISISDFPYTKLYANWSNFIVTDKRTDKTISVPKSIQISCYIGHKLKNILKQPFSAYVVLVHQNYVFHL